jgi:orotidine-5'-phosphate decarboxylase
MSGLVVALDVPQAHEAEAIVDELYDFDVVYKIGLESLFGYGERILRYCEARDVRCCIDAKLSDIPRTAAAAARALLSPVTRMLTVHALGGSAMLRAVVEGVRDGAHERGITPPLVFAVTILTSLDANDVEELGFAEPPVAAALRLAELAREAGCDGVVCSASETRAIKAAFGDDLLALVPGIRPAGAQAADQRRSATPQEAVTAGADYLVVGRPIVGAADRRAATAEILEAMALQRR